MNTDSLGFIGGGRITKIFLQAFANRNSEFSTIMVFDSNVEVLSALKSRFPHIIVADTLKQVAQQKIVFVALHPPMIMETLENIAGLISKHASVISLAPKITIEKFASKVETGNIARLIPNATSYINEGFNPVTFNPGFDSIEKIKVLELLDLLGKTIEVPESKLEAYAILSAMLPTYFWFQWNELIDIGSKMGLSEEDSRQAVYETTKAALNLFFDPSLTSENVMDLIPIKPIGDCQPQFIDIYRNKLLGLYEKIKP